MPTSSACAAAFGMRSGEVVGLRIPIDGTAAGDAFRTGETLVVEDATSDPRVFLPAIEALRPGPVVYAPLVAADETLGVLSVDNAKGGRAFDALDIQVVDELRPPGRVRARAGPQPREP